MIQNIFDHPIILVMGTGIGFIFGFLLQKGRVAKFDVIIGQLLLKNFTMLKIMMTAILVGSVLVYGSIALGAPRELLIGPFSLLAVILGAALVGLGMAILGYCPGTAVAAAGEGARDAIFGIIGLIIGAGLYAALYPWINQTILQVWPFPAKATIATLLQISHWVILGAIIALAFFGFKALEKWELKRTLK